MSNDYICARVQNMSSLQSKVGGEIGPGVEVLGHESHVICPFGTKKSFHKIPPVCIESNVDFQSLRNVYHHPSHNSGQPQTLVISLKQSKCVCCCLSSYLAGVNNN